MQIKKLTLAHYRGILDTTIEFKPGFNLIVGVNGAGKSSVLEVLRVLLARALPQLTPAGTFNLGFAVDDITVNRNQLSATIDFVCHHIGFSLTLSEQREKTRPAVDPTSGLKDIRDVEELPRLRRHERPEHGDPRLEGTLRGQTSVRPESPGELTPKPSPKLREEANQPLVLYLSVRRSVANDRTPRGKGKTPAYLSIFDVERGLELKGFADWWQARVALAGEDQSSRPARQLAAVKTALQTLLPSFVDWRVVDGVMTTSKQVTVAHLNEDGAVIEKIELRPLAVRWLSDGERSLITIAADIAQRLASLNEAAPEPLQTGQGVVLLDEIDLHLHPSWQRRVVIDLPKVFPSLQFIATSHSPQVVGETEPGRAMLLHEGGRVEVLDESLGRDSGWILRHVMGTPERNEELQAGLDAIHEFIESEKFAVARERVRALRARFGDDKELVGAAAAIDRWEFMGDEADR